MKPINRAYCRGFTLLELMMTFFVLAILAGVAGPSLNAMLLNNRSEALGEELAAAFQMTRAEAIKRGERVTICASNADGTACGGDWTNGWLIVTDEAATDGAAAVVFGEMVAQFDAPHDASEVTATNNGAAVNFVRYTSTGELARIGGNANTAPIILNSFIGGCEGNRQREITIGVAGMMQMARTECPGGY